MIKPTWTSIAMTSSVMNPCSSYAPACVTSPPGHIQASCTSSFFGTRTPSGLAVAAETFYRTPQLGGASIPAREQTSPVPRTNLLAEGFKLTWAALHGKMQGVRATHPDQLAQSKPKQGKASFRKLFREGLSVVGRLDQRSFLAFAKPVHEFLDENHHLYAMCDINAKEGYLEDALVALISALSYEESFTSPGQLTETAKSIALDAIPDAQWDDDPEEVQRLFGEDRARIRQEREAARMKAIPFTKQAVEEAIHDALLLEKEERFSGVPEKKWRVFSEMVSDEIEGRVFGEQARFYADGAFNETFQRLVQRAGTRIAKKRGWMD